MLPKRGTLLVEGGRVSLRLEEAMGFGILDLRLKGKYEAALDELADRLEHATG